MAHPRRPINLWLLWTFAGITLSTDLLHGAEKPLRQAIDAEIRAAWQRQKITPAARAGDPAFLRRVYLDLVGTIPTYDETRHFLESKEANKREKLIDKLLADPRFA